MKQIILGTQLFGSEFTKKKSFEFLDFSSELGIIEFDIAERYPFPESNKLFGETEKIIGEWSKFKKRQKIKLNTKVTGRNNGEIKKITSKRLTPKRIIQSLEDSLCRLKTEYVDTYFLHWPDRYTNNFGRTYYSPDKDKKYIPIEDQFEAIYKLKKQGKILSYGLSNETAWGIMKFCEISKREKLLPVIQEEYSLLNRNIERNTKEIIIREKLKFQCYSPLSGGLLTGKYNKKKPDKSFRLLKYKEKSKKLFSEKKNKRIKFLIHFCKKKNISITKLAFDFLKYQKFLNSIIIGFSSKKQLFKNIELINKPINDKKINQLINLLNDEDSIY